ncbi:MAG: GNAT family N-acetyltransferase [Clostridia bacterium]|nr:GNAT family N-acetyltransferase [Clostridia bacterium]
MEHHVTQICPEDYGTLLSFLNRAFTANPASRHFETNMPRMCNSPERLSQHYVIWDQGRITAAIGIFSYTFSIGNTVLRAATVGNIAVAPEYRGSGYMQALMTYAMQKLTDMQVDLSRLGGLRSRYENYGYEPSGSVFRFLLTPRNGADYLKKNPGNPYRYDALTSPDASVMQMAEVLYNRNHIRLHRSDFGSFHDSMCMWKSKPYAVYCPDGCCIGYLCTDETGSTVFEYGHQISACRMAMLADYVVQTGQEYWITVYPWDLPLCRELHRYAEAYQTSVPSHFKVLHWDVVLQALLTLKRKLKVLPTGQLCVKIGTYGNVRIVVDADGCWCDTVSSDIPADLCLHELIAAQVFFGPGSPAELISELSDPAQALLLHAWFPLPLSWNQNDNL